MGLLDVRAQEAPRRVGVLVGGVPADMAAPDDADTETSQRAGEASGLRVVQQHDVARSHDRAQLREVRFERRFVCLALPLLDRAAVTRCAVQSIVESLGDVEEAGRGIEGKPADVDAGSAAVGQERLKHLCDAAPGGGGVDVPHSPTGEEGAGSVRGHSKLSAALAVEQSDQPLDRDGVDLHLLHAPIVTHRAADRHPTGRAPEEAKVPERW